MTVAIPLVDLAALHAPLRAEIDTALARVVSSGRFILGPEVEAFEAALSAYVGVRHAVGVSSGTAALQLALLAAGIGPGDEVITVSFTAVATVAAIQLVGAQPVLVDIDPTRFTLDPERLVSALTRRTRAIVPVHLYGCPADLGPILAFAERNRLIVIEDCAQALGAQYQGRPVGARGHFGAYSFYPTKNLGALGDGGAVVTNHDVFAQRVRELRQFGWRDRYISESVGVNARLDELQAAVLAVKLPYLKAWNARRQQIATCYAMTLVDAGVELPHCPDACEHVFHQYVIRTRARDRLRFNLARQGVATWIPYPKAVHQQPAYAGRVRTPTGLAHSELATSEILALPIHPGLTDEEVAQVAEAVYQGIREPDFPTGSRAMR